MIIGLSIPSYERFEVGGARVVAAAGCSSGIRGVLEKEGLYEFAARQPDAVPQDSTRIYDTILVDQDGVPLDPSDIDTITATLTQLDGTVIVAATSVKNVNGGTLAAQGAFSLALGPGQTFPTAMISTDPTVQFEQHRLCFVVTTIEGDVDRHEVYFYIERLSCAA